MNNVLNEIIRMKAMMGLAENLNLADKLFFRPGKLSPEVREGILDITEGNNFTNLVASMYYHFQKDGQYNQGIMRLCEDFNDELINYNKNLFPIPGNLNDYKLDVSGNNFHVLTLFEMLKNRNLLIYQWSKVPEIIKRNLNVLIKNQLYGKKDTALGSDHEQDMLAYNFKNVAEKLKEMNEMLKRLPQHKYDEIVPKLFSSKVNSFDDVKKGVENLQNTLSMLSNGMGFTEDQIYDMAHSHGCKIVKHTPEGAIVVKVTNAQAMQEMGCFSSWCFSIPGESGEGWWDQYAQKGYVYLIYNMDMDVEDARCMMVYLPDTGTLYLSNNQPYEDVFRDMPDSSYLYTLGIDAGRELR